jgi:hypothetical protein
LEIASTTLDDLWGTGTPSDRIVLQSII